MDDSLKEKIPLRELYSRIKHDPRPLLKLVFTFATGVLGYDKLEEGNVMHQTALLSNYLGSELMLRSTSPPKAGPPVRLITSAYSC